ncbi:MAG: HD domain-containing protein [Firmicutes bacterium]|nr:HD domain-containing protein [Bacillota bacterium]
MNLYEKELSILKGRFSLLLAGSVWIHLPKLTPLDQQVFTLLWLAGMIYFLGAVFLTRYRYRWWLSGVFLAVDTILISLAVSFRDLDATILNYLYLTVGTAAAYLFGYRGSLYGSALVLVGWLLAVYPPANPYHFLYTILFYILIFFFTGHLQDQEIRQAKRLRVLNRIAQSLQADPDPDAIVGAMLDETAGELEADRCLILLHDKERGTLVARGPRGAVAWDNPRDVILHLEERGLSARVFQTGEPCLCHRPPKDEPLQSLQVQDTNNTSVMIVPLNAQQEKLGVLHITRARPGRRFSRQDLGFAATLAGGIGMVLKEINLIQDLRRSHYDTVRGLSRAIEAKDPYTRGHSERVAHLALRLAEAVNLEDRDREVILMAGYLHDIGKIGIRGTILNKVGWLTREEFLEVQAHSEIGFEILMKIEHLRAVAVMVRHHHERWQGDGYPDQLAGPEIPLGARVLALADAYDAMTSDRSYRKALSPSEAAEMIRRNLGTQFDPSLGRNFVDVVLDAVGRIPYVETYREKYRLEKPEPREDVLSGTGA